MNFHALHKANIGLGHWLAALSTKVIGHTSHIPVVAESESVQKSQCSTYVEFVWQPTDTLLRLPFEHNRIKYDDMQELGTNSNRLQYHASALDH